MAPAREDHQQGGGGGREDTAPRSVLTASARALRVAAGAPFLPWRGARAMRRVEWAAELPSAPSWGPLSTRSLGTAPSLPRPAAVALGPAPHSLDVTTHYTEPLSTKLGLWQLYYKFITC